METEQMSFSVGDSVVVKPGIIDPDFENNISGWQGRIEEIDDEGWISIRWDSSTLKQMSLDLIIQCENENLDWEQMTLGGNELQNATERDSVSDTTKMAEEIRLQIKDDPRLNDNDDDNDDE